FARIEDNPDNDAAVVSVVQRVDDDWVGKGIGGEVDRALGGCDQPRVDRVEALLGRVVDLLREGGGGEQQQRGHCAGDRHCGSSSMQLSASGEAKSPTDGR